MVPPISLYETTALTMAASMSSSSSSENIISGSSSGADLWVLLHELAHVYGGQGQGLSRALVMSLAHQWKNRPDLLYEAQRHWYSSGRRPELRPMSNTDDDSHNAQNSVSVSCLNVLLCAHALRGDLGRVKELWDEFDRNQWRPDLDSYSFALDGLTRHVLYSNSKNPKRRKRQGRRSVHDDDDDDYTRFGHVLQLAESYLTQLESHDLEPNVYVIRSYVELLCATNQVDVAVDVLRECPPADAKAVYRVVQTLCKNCAANPNLDHQVVEAKNYYETAQELARLLPQVPPRLEQALANFQQDQQQQQQETLGAANAGSSQ